MGMLIYTGTIDGTREYIASSISKLNPGSRYKVSMSVSLADNSRYGINNLGIYFYDSGINIHNTKVALAVSPQISYSDYGAIKDTANWVRLTQYFIADSAYDNIVIGGFAHTVLDSNTSNNNLRSYYYFDSIVIYNADSLSVIISDSIVCRGDTLPIGYTALGDYDINNTFTAQLSDALGNFSNPVTIGSVISNTSGTINCLIPPGTPTGTQYHIRIISTNIADTTKNNHTNITIGSIIKPVAQHNTPICINDTLLLAASTPTALVNYTWAGPLGFIANQQYVAVPATDTAMSGKYIVTITNEACMAKDTIDVLVQPIPDSPIIVSNSPLIVGGSLLLELTNPKPGASFSWIGPDGFKSYLHKPYIATTTAANAGKYILTTTMGTCTKTAEIDVVIQGAEDAVTIVLYPNPNNGTFKIEGPVNNNNTIPIGIYSIMGQLIHKQDIIPVNKTVSENITLGGKLASGVYFVKLVVNGEARVIPMTVSR